MTIKYKSVKEFKEMISQKEISNKEIIQEVFNLIDDNKGLNAFITLNISKPIFGGINKERAKAEPINFESNLYNLIYFCTVGPAGLEPATDGL